MSFLGRRFGSQFPLSLVSKLNVVLSDGVRTVRWQSVQGETVHFGPLAVAVGTPFVPCSLFQIILPGRTGGLWQLPGPRLPRPNPKQRAFYNLVGRNDRTTRCFRRNPPCPFFFRLLQLLCSTAHFLIPTSSSDQFPLSVFGRCRHHSNSKLL
jgi:hypothetical protein